MLLALDDRQWLWIAAAFYFVVFVQGTISQLRGRPQSLGFNYALMAIGYACQLAGLYLRGMEVGGCPLGNHFEIIQFTAWSATTLYLLVGVTFRSSLLGHFTACLTAVLSLVSLLVPSWDATRRSGIFGENAWIEFHAALAVFSYGVFALLALTSLMFLLRNYSLKSKRVGGWFSFLPSIVELEQISLRLLIAGVALLTASLVVGSVWWFQDTGSTPSTKIGITVAVWAAYLVALSLRLAGPLQARRFAWACIILFAGALASLSWVGPGRTADSTVATRTFEP
jgi:HemX protein